MNIEFKDNVVTTTKTNKLVIRFIEWAIDLKISLVPKPQHSDDEIKARLARMDTLEWAIENLKRIRDEIDAEYASKS